MALQAQSEASEGLVRIHGDFNAVPLARSIRQEVMLAEQPWRCFRAHFLVVSPWHEDQKG